MKILVETLRVIVWALVLITVFATTYAGYMQPELFGLADPIMGAVVMGVAGLFGSAIIYGLLALLFQIHDHLAAIRKHLEGVSNYSDTSTSSSDRIEPKL